MGEEAYGLGDRLADALRLADEGKSGWTGGDQRRIAIAQVTATVAVAEAIEALTQEIADLRRDLATRPVS